MQPLDRAKLLLAKAQDDETLLEEVISNQRIKDEIIGFHFHQKLLNNTSTGKEHTLPQNTRIAKMG